MQLYAVCNSGQVSRALFGKSSGQLPNFSLSNHNCNLYVTLEDVLIAIWTKHALCMHVRALLTEPPIRGGTQRCFPSS